MSCYKPLKAFRTPHGVVFQELSRHDIIGDAEIPCGRCAGCRQKRAVDWTVRCMHEAQLYEASCFVTLTYSQGNLPADGSLEHRDFQLFAKRLNWFNPTPVRYYMCGEYGPLNFRPHYHACLFGVDFRSDWQVKGKSASGAVFYDSPTLSSLWRLGSVSVQPLTRETAGYCARYIMSKRLGRDAAAYVTADGVIRRPEYAAMSLKPGIGYYWFKLFGGDVYPHDFVIADGSKLAPPKYYDKLLRRNDSALVVDEIAFERELKARKCASDNTPERRAVRELVHEARLGRFTGREL